MVLTDHRDFISVLYSLNLSILNKKFHGLAELHFYQNNMEKLGIPVRDTGVHPQMIWRYLLQTHIENLPPFSYIGHALHCKVMERQTFNENNIRMETKPREIILN